MRTYILRRILLAVPTIFAVIILVFLSLHLSPGDPIDMMIPPDASGPARTEMVERLERQHGFDQPLHNQFAIYLSRLARLDLGVSLRSRRPIANELRVRIPLTLQLGLLAMFISIVIGIGFGIVSAIKRDTILDNATTFGALFGVSIPNFFFGFVLMILFGLYWRILPPSGYGGSIFTWEGFKHAIMPSLTLGTSSAAILARYTRSSMLDVIKLDYIRTARSKGLAERVVITKHALRNALIPVVTLLGMRIGSLLSGSIITESVFAWPGVGRYLIGAISGRDFPVVQATVLIIAVGYIAGNLMADISYAIIDPRIHYD